MEKILSIEEIIDFKPGKYNEYDGYKISTTENDYFILIDNDQQCCENWGYFSTNDNIQDFIGKTLLGVELTSTALDNAKVQVGDLDYGGIQFVNFKCTDGNTLQFAVYNAHNGYYGHRIRVMVNKKDMYTDWL